MCQTVLTPIRSGQNVRPDLGENCLKGLSADGNVMLKFNAKLKYISSTQLFITSKVSYSLDPIRSGQNVGPDLGQNCLKGLSADDNVISRFNAKKNTSVQLQLVITSKVSNSLDP